MEDYQSDLVEVIKKALKENKTAALDKERLKKAKRTGLSCAQDNKASKLCSNNA